MESHCLGWAHPHPFWRAPCEQQQQQSVHPWPWSLRCPTFQRVVSQFCSWYILHARFILHRGQPSLTFGHPATPNHSEWPCSQGHVFGHQPGLSVIALRSLYNWLCYSLVQGIFAKIGPDLELRGGDLISSPVDSIVSLVSPKKSYGPNSVGKNYFSATPFSLN